MTDLTDPNHPTVIEALERSCDVCGAVKGQPCVHAIYRDRSLSEDAGGRIVHFGRLVDRRRQPKEDA